MSGLTSFVLEVGDGPNNTANFAFEDATGGNSTASPSYEITAEGTFEIDASGGVIMPGMIDTHVHIDCAAVNTKLATSCHIPPVEYVEVHGETGSKEAILNFVRQSTEEQEVGEWIIGQGRFSLESEGNSPSRAELDAVAPDHPVMIRYSAHSQLLNSKALEITDITREGPTFGLTRRAPIDELVDHLRGRLPA